MGFRDLSVEELLDLEEELLKERDISEDVSFSRLIGVYEELYKKITASKNSHYRFSLHKIREQLIFYLIEYGTYLKTVYKKDDRAAEMSLKKAIRYERNLPIAYYRLGFLNYKNKNYSDSLKYFQHAINYQQQNNSTYEMNEQQLYNSHLYLANCGLFIAANAHEKLDKLGMEMSREELPQYEVSPLYPLINENTKYLERHAYKVVTKEESKYMSKEEYENLMERKNTIILDLTGREDLLSFNHSEVRLNKNQAEILRYFFMKSSRNQPVTKYDIFDIFAKSNNSGEIPTNTYVQNITRLRRKLQDLNIQDKLIENKNGSRETAYFYNGMFEYCIIHRSDETFILQE
ncbi:Transcriptional regulatory protein, C terminal [Oceanobacillus limi]|uniref:Transcriptional regulatory protein, C terminal n=1 Tax=Oceanobacillus limi TaxID=930131 RepID=A0A1I0FHD3_9BACI|nr:hypothetical protein [Oceanobacillus limi]SET56618.1 Transcriptional regulatory protein, C terminal [Oceanobacillus limi]